ncbi:MAG: SUMF1/EgtB/PvdO family nonheme iron enzyme [Geminicoccaceae bacterium]
MSTKMIKRRMLTILAATALTSSCGFAALHQAAHGTGITHPVKAREVLHPDLLALLTDEEIQTVESVMNRQTGKRHINVEDFFASNVLPETQPKPAYPENVEIVQDCENCPKLAVIPAGSFDRKPILLPGVTYDWSYSHSCHGAGVDRKEAEETFEYCNEDYWKELGLDGFPKQSDPELACIDYINHGRGTRECSSRQFENFPNGHLLPMEPDIIHVDRFALGITEVTIKQFRRFVEETAWESQWTCRLVLERQGHYETESAVKWDQFPANAIAIEGYESTGEAIAGNAPRDDEPVHCISYDDAIAYTDWLSKKTGHTYRLPSQLEWQYAARAGADTPYWWGWRRIAGRDEENPFKRQPAIQGWPSPYGLYGMHGNAYEWMADCVLDIDDRTLKTLQPYLFPTDALGFRTYSLKYMPTRLWVASFAVDYRLSRADQWPGGYWRKDGKARSAPSECWWRAAAGPNALRSSGWQEWRAVPMAEPLGHSRTRFPVGFRVARDLN